MLEIKGFRQLYIVNCCQINFDILTQQDYCKGEEYMGNRPILSKEIDAKTFQEYYYLKEELINFCRENDLQTTGGKIDLTNRIYHYLSTGQKNLTKTTSKNVSVVDIITEDTLVEDNFVCSEKHRAFFEQVIGNGFKFNVIFQKWLKSNTGKTYKEAVIAYYQILEEKKTRKTTIEKQFEYNTYIRDFFEDNKGKSLDESIRCWRYKKELQGHNKYEKSDLIALIEP